MSKISEPHGGCVIVSNPHIGRILGNRTNNRIGINMTIVNIDDATSI